MIRRPPRSTPLYSSAASDVYKRQGREVGRVKDLREAIEDSVDRGYIDLEIVRGGKLVEVRVPIVVQEL